MSYFGGREREIREIRESGTVTFIHVCYSALAVRREGFVHNGTLLGCCVLLLDDVIC